MNTLFCNLSFLKKLAIPAAFIIVAGLATVISAAHWAEMVDRKVGMVIDLDAVRLERALTAVSNLQTAAVFQRDLLRATTTADAERQATTYRQHLAEVESELDGLLPLMVDAEQHRIVEEAKDAYKQFLAVTEESVVNKIESIRTQTPVAKGGEGRKWRGKVDELLGKIVDISKADMRQAKTDTLDTNRGAAVRLVAVSAAAQLFALVLLGWISIIQVSRPLSGMAQLMRRLAAGELEIEVIGGQRRDEVGVLARALTVFKENAVSARKLGEEQRAEQAQRDARARAVEEHIESFKGPVQSALDMLAAAATRMRSTSASMSAAAESGGQQSASVLAASEQAAANVQSVASACEELSASISEISTQVSHAAQITGKAVHQTEETDSKVRKLAEAAERIGEVVNLISDIASQTNLLALNATIEAARAGEAGKGFAVVASEVKALATQTANATEEITSQISAIRDATGTVVQGIGAIGGTINQVNEISSSIASAVEQQSAVTRDISRNTQEAATNTTEVTRNVAGLNEMAGETRSAATQELASADDLGRHADTLRREIGAFLGKIRAA
jgi:methyl-accepting chemotaxis protein